MERQRVRKALALVTAALLVAAFVLYRAGFDTVFMTSSKSTFILVGSSVKAPDAPPTPVQPGERLPPASDR